MIATETITTSVLRGIVRPIVRPVTNQITNFDITVGLSATHIGYWVDRTLGSTTEPQVSRLSITVSNGVMFFDCDPVETQQNITLRFSAGDVLMGLSSGRYTSSSVPPAVRALFDIDGNVVPVEIIR